MNMSAQILRGIVSSVVSYPAHKIKLSGTIEPDKKWHQDGGHSWWHGAAEDYYTIWGFSPQHGLVQLDIEMSYAYSQNGERQPEGQSETLAEFIARDGRKFIFFVEMYSGKEYGESGQRFCEYTIYKAPNFAAHWAAIEEKDIQRWEEWLNA